MIRRAGAIALCALVGIGAGCLRDQTFTCADSSDCRSSTSNGTCEPTGFCSFPDGDCDTGQRYGEHSGDLSGKCVVPPGTDTTGDDGLDTQASVDSASDDPSDPTAPGMTTSDGIGTWWHCDWPTRRELRIALPEDYEPMSDVPVLVVLDEVRIDYGGTAAGGADLRFVAADDTNALHHEIESWDAGGTSYAWLRLPELVPGEQSVFMYYGNPDATALTDVDPWSAEYRGVWHLDADAHDASGGGQDGVEMGVLPAQGWAGSGRRIRQSDEFVIVDDALGISDSFATGGTVSAFFRPESAFGQGRMVGKSVGDNADNGWLLAYDFDRSSVTFVHGFASGRGTWRGSDGVAPPLAWAHVAVTFDHSAIDPTPAIYVNGVPIAVDLQGGNHSGAPSSDAGQPLTFGVSAELGGGTSFVGILDEVRLESTIRTPAWIAVQHSSFMDTLVEYGPEVQSNCD